MLAFPSLLSAAGPLQLPLSGRTAERIVDALLAANRTPEQPTSADRLHLVLAGDAAFALWATLRAEQCGMPPMRTTAALCDWLAGIVVNELAATADFTAPATVNSPARDKKQAALVAKSIGIATLAANIARHRSLDESAAYLLGLLHLAPQWLATVLPRAASTEAHVLLPRWLADALAEVAGADSIRAASTAGCVALALQLAAGPARSNPAASGFKWDRRRHKAEAAAFARQWLEPSPATDWLRELAARLQRLRTLETDFELMLEVEKLESLKELAQGAGHEINNPLANISTRAQTLLTDETDPQRRRLLSAINTQALRAHEMIGDMMLFARPPQLHRAESDLGALLQTLANQFAAQAAAQHVELVYAAPASPILALVDATQIHEALCAVVINALEALVAGGRIELTVRGPSAPGDAVRIVVADTGPGIPGDVRRHLFDPFYSGREAGRGLGFGLAKCWRIVRLHGGQIEVGCPPEGGATFTIVLPADALR
ncbi:MAG: HAMP domain-containing sensor histidine kinase [Pirellulales bacterium]